MIEEWRHKSMTVKQLIEALSKCDPNANVVVDDERDSEDIDNEIYWYEMQAIVGIEVGYADGDIVDGQTFSLEAVGEYLVPAVRLLSANCQLTDPARTVNINGVGPAKEVKAVDPFMAGWDWPASFSIETRKLAP